jgi:CRP/FNR family cyclic AMP-dependent transcriptional regulator
VLSLDGPGTSLAELPVFDGGVYPASAAATKDSEVIFISRSDFRSLCLERPEVALKLLEVVGGRLRRLVGIIEELSFTTVRQRLIRYLLRQARASGKQAGPARVFAIDGNYQAIAAEIGTVRDLVSRTLARLQAQGLLTVEGREITIPDICQFENEEIH